MSNIQPSAYKEPNLDRDMRRIYLMAQNIPAQGAALVTGKYIGWPTGLVTVVNCTGSIDNGAVAHAYTLTVTPSITVIGGLDLYVWTPTASGDTTPIAATVEVKVRWQAQGTL